MIRYLSFIVNWFIIRGFKISIQGDLFFPLKVSIRRNFSLRKWLNLFPSFSHSPPREVTMTYRLLSCCGYLNIPGSALPCFSCEFSSSPPQRNLTWSGMCRHTPLRGQLPCPLLCGNRRIYLPTSRVKSCWAHWVMTQNYVIHPELYQDRLELMIWSPF